MLLLGTIHVYANETEVTIHLPDTFMKVQEYGEAYFNVRIKNCGEAAEFHVEYSRDSFNTVFDSGTYTISSNGEKVIKISDNLPKGSYVMSVRVTSGDKEWTASQRMAVMKEYEQQFMDDYTRIGVHVGLPVPNKNKTTYLSDKKRVENSLRLLTMSGIRMTRFGTSTTWESLENEKGELTSRNARIDLINGNPTAAFVNLNVSNEKYGGVMKTREQMGNFEEYAKKRLTTSIPKSQFFAELGNEPDLEKFWPGRDVYGIQYMNLARYASLTVRGEREDYSLIGGVTSGGTNAVPFLEYMFQQDAYKYLDGYSYHPYIKSSGVDGKYDSFTKPYEEVAKGKGGWLQKMITEIGWDSAWEGTTSVRGHEEIAMEMTKVFMKTYLHDLDLTCYYSLVNNLGLQPQNDFSVASAAVVAASQITDKLNSALYVGEYPLAEGVMCAMFLRNNEPLMVVWMPGEESVVFNFDSPVTVEDIYGNIIYEGSSVEIDEKVCYISGFGMNYIYKTAESVKNKSYEEIEQKYGQEFNTAIFDYAKQFSSGNIASDPEKMAAVHYNIGDRLIDEYLSGNTSLEINELSEALFTLHVAGEKLANVYSLTPEAGNTISEKYLFVKNKAKEKKGTEKNSTLLYTDKILKYAQRAYNKAVDASERENSVIKQGIIASCSFVSEHLSIWAEKIMSVENPDDTIGVLTITEPYCTEFYQSTKEAEVKYTIDNRRNKAIDGEIVVINGDGKVLSDAVPAKLDANTYKDITITIPNDYSNKESDFYKICLMENGKILNEKLFPVIRQKALDVELANAQVLFGELSRLSVKLTNNTPDTQKGRAKISVPDGWTLASDELEYTVDGFETKLVDFEITSKKQVPFNMYNFGIQVIKDDGMELFNEKVPLNFSVLVEAEREYMTEDFDGNITDWQNAYPIYAGYPDNPDDSVQWKNSDVGAIAFLKYDKNYIYIMANVYDNIFHGKYTGTSMWRNDSLQMLFDPLNNGGDTVQSDDIAFITGHTSAGKECLKTLGPNGVTQANNVPYENAVTVIRDNSVNQTRYLVKLPVDAVSPMQFTRGTRFRFNICFNDSDVEDRNNVVQVTKGLLEGGTNRKPGLYYEFVMAGTDALGAVDPGDLRLELTIDSEPLDFK